MDAKTALLAIEILLSVGIVISILLQSSGAGLGNAFSGAGGGEFFRSKRGIEKTLFNITVLLIGLFVVTSIAIAYAYKS